MQLGWVGGCFGKNESCKNIFAWKIMANIIKVGVTYYDITRLLKALGGEDGVIFARKGLVTHEEFDPIHANMLQLIKKHLGEELDNFQILIRCNDDKYRVALEIHEKGTYINNEYLLLMKDMSWLVSKRAPVK